MNSMKTKFGRFLLASLGILLFSFSAQAQLESKDDVNLGAYKDLSKSSVSADPVVDSYNSDCETCKAHAISGNLPGLQGKTNPSAPGTTANPAAKAGQDGAPKGP